MNPPSTGRLQPEVALPRESVLVTFVVDERATAQSPRLVEGAAVDAATWAQRGESISLAVEQARPGDLTDARLCPRGREAREDFAALSQFRDDRFSSRHPPLNLHLRNGQRRARSSRRGRTRDCDRDDQGDERVRLAEVSRSRARTQASIILVT